MNSELYSSKRILAPMVRAGRTPLRKMALDYGADLVYTEEIVDQKLLNCKRIENASIDSVDYILGDEVVLRIASEEKARCIVQIGTNSPENAVKICHTLSSDVAAIDVNMGCPKPFSVHAGMGAALLSEPEKVRELLTAMVSISTVPISCKIRLLNSREQTMEFVKMVERAGVSAIAVHGRQRDERPRHQCRTDEIRELCRYLTVPIIANGGSGDIRSYGDIERFREETGASSVMVARRALSNPSIFQSNRISSFEEEIEHFLHNVCRYDENYTNTKYVLQRILGSRQEFDLRGRQTVTASTVSELCQIWGMDDEYRKHRRKHSSSFIELDDNDESIAMKRARNDDQKNGVHMRLVNDSLIAELSFPPKRLKDGLYGKSTPKCVLNKYCTERRLSPPEYHSYKRVQDHRFMGTVCVNGKKFGSSISQPNIKMAEQVAALVALYGFDIRHNLDGDWD